MTGAIRRAEYKVCAGQSGRQLRGCRPTPLYRLAPEMREKIAVKFRGRDRRHHRSYIMNTQLFFFFFDLFDIDREKARGMMASRSFTSVRNELYMPCFFFFFFLDSRQVGTIYMPSNDYRSS